MSRWTPPLRSSRPRAMARISAALGASDASGTGTYGGTYGDVIDLSYEPAAPPGVFSTTLGVADYGQTPPPVFRTGANGVFQ